MFRILFVLCCLIALAPAPCARADRDIVYSARYYTPPGSNRRSHVHLYRINPDGTGRTQITFGKFDDSDPLWSPGGQWIAFMREGGLCLVRPDGRGLRTLLAPPRYSGDDRFCLWSPDYQQIAVVSPQGNLPALLLDSESGKVVARLPGADVIEWSPSGSLVCAQYPDHADILSIDAHGARRLLRIRSRVVDVSSLVWASNQLLVGTQAEPKSRVALVAIDLHTGDVRRVDCAWPSGPINPYANSIDPWGQSLEPGPPHVTGRVVYVQDTGYSGNRPCNEYFLADLRTGRMRDLTGGQFLTWALDGVRFCTSAPHTQSPYGPVIDGYQKTVNTAPLDIGRVGGGDPVEIVSGLVWVTGADWRKK